MLGRQRRRTVSQIGRKLEYNLECGGTPARFIRVFGVVSPECHFLLDKKSRPQTPPKKNELPPARTVLCKKVFGKGLVGDNLSAEKGFHRDVSTIRRRPRPTSSPAQLVPLLFRQKEPPSHSPQEKRAACRARLRAGKGYPDFQRAPSVKDVVYAIPVPLKST